MPGIMPGTLYAFFSNTICNNNVPEIYYYFHFTDKKTEPLKDEIICPTITLVI